MYLTLLIIWMFHLFIFMMTVEFMVRVMIVFIDDEKIFNVKFLKPFQWTTNWTQSFYVPIRDFFLFQFAWFSFPQRWSYNIFASRILCKLKLPLPRFFLNYNYIISDVSNTLQMSIKEIRDKTVQVPILLVYSVVQ